MTISSQLRFDPEVVRYMDWGSNTEEARNIIQRAIANQKERHRRNCTLATILKAEDRLIGGCSVDVSNRAIAKDASATA